MGGCQKYGPFLGTLNIRGRIIIGTPKRDHNFDNHPYDIAHYSSYHVGFSIPSFPAHQRPLKSIREFVILTLADISLYIPQGPDSFSFLRHP